MQDFDYVCPKSASEALAILSHAGAGARILSGGTDLIPQLREGRRKVRLVVDIKRLPETNVLSFEANGGLTIGAAVPCQRICQDEAVQQVYPGLVEAVSLIGGVQIQNRASLGGNLCNASPAADSLPALIVHHASCLITGPGGERVVPLEDFCIAPGQTILQPGELLISIRLPPPPKHFGAAYLRFIPRNEMDIAVVGAGAAVTLDESMTRFTTGRVALAAVAPKPLFVPQVGEFLAGKPVSTEVIAEAARLAEAAARPINDMRGTIPQRKHLSKVLTRRALEKAVQRAAM